MESNIADQETFDAESPLAEPHFDEEATLLSARPVVPLETVTAKPRSTRPWVLGLALAGALLLGFSATTIYYSRIDGNKSQTFANVETISSGVEARATAPDHSNDLQLAAAETPRESSTSVEETSEVTPTDRPPDSSPENSTKPVARRVDVLTSRTSPDREKEIRDERKAARQEEKERRREAKREMRANKSSDDLLRIREIFEGPQKP